MLINFHKYCFFFYFSKQRREKGMTILVLAETAEEITLNLLDKAIVLITAHVKISTILVWRPGSKSNECDLLSNSKILVSNF